MRDEAIHKPSATQPDPRVQLAFERTFLAYERTQIAWVRTAFALISFGFAIAKFFQYLREKQGETATLMSPRAIGLVMITHWTGRVDSRKSAGAAGLEGLTRALSRTADTDLRCDGGADRAARRPCAGWRLAAIRIESVCS